MNARVAVSAVAVAVLVGVVASLLLDNTDVSHRIIGVLYVLAGAVIMVCARAIPQHALSPELPAFLRPLMGVRPRTLVLVGGATAIFGAILISGAA